ncbi:MAG: thiamine-phosphate kinase [Bryobacteraceae bacterium]
MNETQLIRLIQRRAPSFGARSLILGIGDDCAVLRPSGSAEDWVVTTDMVLEDVHFLRGAHPPAAVGHRVLARGLSDIAAMGAEPRVCFLSLALAPWTDSRWLNGFFRGFYRLASRTRTTLAGGDLAHAEKLACDIVVCGAIPKGEALRRDGARPGDGVYISGQLGGSALGLRTRRGRAWDCHLAPQPRLDLGRFLRARLRASSAMDLSDGLSIDLHRLALASGVAAELECQPPTFPGATLEDALHGGEDYELLFTLPPAARPPSAHRGIRITRIGTIRKGKPGLVRLFGRPLEPRGYDHFRGRT